jgi:hypothetical protein
LKRRCGKLMTGMQAIAEMSAADMRANGPAVP